MRVKGLEGMDFGEEGHRRYHCSRRSGTLLCATGTHFQRVDCVRNTGITYGLTQYLIDEPSFRREYVWIYLLQDMYAKILLSLL